MPRAYGQCFYPRNRLLVWLSINIKSFYSFFIIRVLFRLVCGLKVGYVYVISTSFPF